MSAPDASADVASDTKIALDGGDGRFGDGAQGAQGDASADGPGEAAAVQADGGMDAADASSDNASDGGDAASDGPLAETAPETGPVALRYVQGAEGSFNNTASATLSFNQLVGAGDAIIVAVDFDSTSFPTITDTLGSSFTVVASNLSTMPGGTNMYVALAENVAGGMDAITITVDVSSNAYFEMYLHEYAGLALHGAFDVANTGTGTSPGPDGMSGGVVMTSAPGELIFGYGTTGEAAAGTGFTVRLTLNSNITEDQVAGPPGPYTATATMLSGNIWQMITAAFRTQ
jgi:hypothetical protein